MQQTAEQFEQKPSDYISTFRGIEPAPTNPVKRYSYLTPLRWVQQRKLKDKIKQLRKLKSEEEERYKAQKVNLPGVTFSGRFDGGRKKEHLAESTGFLVADIDNLPSPDMVLSQTCSDPYVWFSFVSPGGEGLKIGFRAFGIKTDADFKKFFVAIEQYIADHYGYEIDKACKNINRLTYLSSDPVCYINPEAQFFPVIVRPTKKEIAPPEPSLVAPSGDLAELTKLLMDISPDCEYDDWLATGMALHHETEGSEQGLQLWKQWSSGFYHDGSTKYKPNDCSPRWKGFSSDRADNDLVTIGTLRNMALNLIPKINVPGEINSKNVCDLMFERFGLEDDFVKKLGNPDHIYKRLLMRGHVVVIIGPPSSGKTMLAVKVIAPHLARKFKVIYIDIDSPATLLGHIKQAAKDGNFTILNPNTRPGESAVTILDYLRQLIACGIDLSNYVFFFDTLKKFAKLLDKNDVKNFFALARQLNTLGATVIILAHANKYPDAEGHLVYEGTGDVKADCDDLFFLYPIKFEKKQVVATTVFEDINPYAKSSGIYDPISYQIDRESLKVTVLEQVLPVQGIPSAAGHTSVSYEEIQKAAAEFLQQNAQIAINKKNLILGVKNLIAPRVVGRDRIRDALDMATRVEGEEAIVFGKAIYFKMRQGGHNNTEKFYDLTEEGTLLAEVFDE